VRKEMGETAVRIGKEIGYNNAGTIEFLVDKELNFYFLEMNTRIQVEHPVTELVTGIDIVEEQIHIAAGYPMRLVQNEIQQAGHAIECRIYAEDPENNFLPSPGIMTLYKEPVRNNIRLDTGITADTIIKSSFDPMICKLIAWGKNRNEARKLMITALDDYIIHGIRTNISYLKKLLKSEEFIGNKISTRFCDLHTTDIVNGIKADQKKIFPHIPVIGYLISDLHPSSFESTGIPKSLNLWETIGYWRNLMNVRLNLDSKEYSVEIPECEGNHYRFRIDGENFSVIRKSYAGHKLEYSINDQLFKAYISGNKNNQGFLSLDGYTFHLKRNDILAEQTSASTFESSRGDSNLITSPMPGKVIRINVKEGDPVKKGDLLLIIEAMKMENMIHAPGDALVAKINVSLNDRVEATTALIILEKTD
jgi:acetyl/propionyl-CoA carboxylase alpha subunit